MKEASFQKIGSLVVIQYGVAFAVSISQEHPKMLYLAIDQHAKQITVCVRNEDGDTVLGRQVSTRPEKIEAFFGQFTELDAEFMAILELCGFNDWLIENFENGSVERLC